MFLSLTQLKASLNRLEPFHAFYGTTFLVSKRVGLPVGSTMSISLDREETLFFDEFYKPAPNSAWYYRVFRPSDRRKKWVPARYPMTTSQTNRTRLQFAKAFIHSHGTNIWGWQVNYLDVLEDCLQERRKVPIFDLAVWIYRDTDWPQGTTPVSVIDALVGKFEITNAEQERLFDLQIPSYSEADLFQIAPISWQDLRSEIGQPPDAPLEEGGTLAYLELKSVGPATRLVFEPAERVSLVTGDNGLGKTFLLECAWWALTGQWVSLPAYPRTDAGINDPKISFKITGESPQVEAVASKYDWAGLTWVSPKDRPTIPGLLVYARVDGSFAVWDPARNNLADTKSNSGLVPSSFAFTRDQVWDGLEGKIGIEGKTSAYINGLIRDWVTWQNKPDRYPFEVFRKVLLRLSPPSAGDLGILEPGDPIRLPYDAREIPTLKHPYGDIPIVYAAAGVRRIVTIAYLIVWAWYEHNVQSSLIRRSPQKRMVIIVDEMEAHLHPQWQRRILPSLLEVSQDLAAGLQTQFIVATHSPLVTASIEPYFDVDKDKLFHLDMVQRDMFKSEVVIEELPFVKYGLVDSWLMSSVFELKHARSLEAEAVIEEAKTLQNSVQPAVERIAEVHRRLVRYLSAEDEFWPRWTFFAEEQGLKL